MHILSPETELPFLNQQKGKNECRKHFMINLHERILPASAGVEPATSWSPVGRCIQLSHRGGRFKGICYKEAALTDASGSNLQTTFCPIFWRNYFNCLLKILLRMLSINGYKMLIFKFVCSPGFLGFFFFNFYSVSTFLPFRFFR